MARHVEVVITADTRAFQRALAQVEHQITRSRWRRLLLRLALWRLDRSINPIDEIGAK